MCVCVCVYTYVLSKCTPSAHVCDTTVCTVMTAPLRANSYNWCLPYRYLADYKTESGWLGHKTMMQYHSGFLGIKSFPVGSHLAGDVRGVSQGARGEVGRALSRGATATSAAAST